jgi:hypothetical protein
VNIGAFVTISSNDRLQNEELITTDYLLKIFRVSIPHMPPTAGKFGQDLQLALQPMIIKPSGSGGVQVSSFQLQG